MLLDNPGPGDNGDDARTSSSNLLSNSNNDNEDNQYDAKTVTYNTVDALDEHSGHGDTNSDGCITISKSTNATERPNNSQSIYNKKRQRDVQELLKDDLFSCDMLWCIFVAAAKSYRFNSILLPFPPMYQVQDKKNMFALKTVISSTPKFSASSSFWCNLNSECQSLLSWVFNVGDFTLKLQEKGSAMKQVKEITGQIGDTPEPSYIFEVIHSQANDDKFEALRDGRECFHAYHGSRFDNFFSILHNGLNTNLNKISVFGEGTYLSSELSVSLLYSQAAEVSQKSFLGSKLSCVAVCQMIDDPSVKCQTKEGSPTQQRNRAKASKTTDPVPEKYYVVQRNDVIRVKYLLVYREQGNKPQKTLSRSSSWLREHKFLLMMLAYVLLLAAIGISNSRYTKVYIDRFWRFLK